MSKVGRVTQQTSPHLSLRTTERHGVQTRLVLLTGHRWPHFSVNFEALPSLQLVRKMSFSDQEFLPHIHSPSSFFSFVSSGKLLTSACNPNVTMIYWLNKWMICNLLYGSPTWALMGWSSHIQKHLRDWYSCIKSAKYGTESGPVNRVTAKETIGMKTKYTSWNIDLTSGGIGATSFRKCSMEPTRSWLGTLLISEIINRVTTRVKWNPSDVMMATSEQS